MSSFTGIRTSLKIGLEHCVHFYTSFVLFTQELLVLHRDDDPALAASGMQYLLQIDQPQVTLYSSQLNCHAISLFAMNNSMYRGLST